MKRMTLLAALRHPSPPAASPELLQRQGLERAAFIQHFRVVSTLMLRDIKTRYGASYFGIILDFVRPFAHISALFAIFIFLGRRAPIGTSVFVFLATAILPFIIWSYTHQRVMASFIQNRPLTNLQMVRYIDIFASSALVELMASTAVAAFVITIILVFDGGDGVSGGRMATLYLLLAYFLGLSTGYLMAALTQIAPGIAMVNMALIPLYWVTSGAFFIPDSLPEQLRAPLSFFPLSHIVDKIRTDIYPSYVSDYSHLSYPILLIVANFFIAQCTMVVFKETISSK